MRAVAVYEAKNRFSEMIAAVEHGEEITITRHGAPVARLVAIGTTEPPTLEQRQRVLSAMKQLRALGGAGSELGCTVQQAIEAGRD
ncbi:MAG: type II toxin-antitoxin system prevent-host-death family antitoxin [Rhodoferax sp.]|nr:type II toxin-antitoxin system prevent-host-death family antitoxin [Rhodoferax sp.]